MTNVSDTNVDRGDDPSGLSVATFSTSHRTLLTAVAAVLCVLLALGVGPGAVGAGWSPAQLGAESPPSANATAETAGDVDSHHPVSRVPASAAVGSNDVSRNFPPQFIVWFTDTPSAVETGEEFTSVVSVRNDGSSGSKTVEFGASNDVVDQKDVYVESGEITQVEFTYTPTDSDPNPLEIMTRSTNLVTRTITHRKISLDLAIDSTPAQMAVGETVAVTATVSNVGEFATAQTIRLHNSTGHTLDTENITLDPGEERTIRSLSWDPAAGDVGERNLTVASSTTSVTRSVRVIPRPLAVRDTFASPTDPDGDGFYEDVRGDGTLDVFDVQTLFHARDSPTVQNDAAAFNFQGSNASRVTVADVQQLFSELA